MALSNTVLDYLVHRHLCGDGPGTARDDLSVREFLRIIRERYGCYVDVAPPGMEIAEATLRANRGYLERRLRDLGLLVGVNDAESMKRLRPRFGPRPATPA